MLTILNTNYKRVGALELFGIALALATLNACSSIVEQSANSPVTQPISAAPIFEMDFENYSNEYQDYRLDMVAKDFASIDKRASGEIRGFDSETKTWTARNQVGLGHLKAEFAANIASGKETGFLFDKAFPDMESASMEYRLKFSPDFVWALGGKLPGLGGAAQGANIPVGCTQDQNNIKNGFSTRLMWRRDGRLVVYTYFPDRQNRCGEDYTFFKAEAGKWYKITQTIALNTPGQRDGQIWMFVDDALVYYKDDAFFREAGKDKVKVNTGIFHTYRGGGRDDPRFHSPRKEHIYFDDFKIWAGKHPNLSYE
ncbi:polysaccharide lyase [Glaciecola sp. SC05]|uniref:polysaccharide lyase n=1 Tax=Glaciecola sp. SC05 TaxID=1987355 RepID=UPI0035288A93